MEIGTEISQKIRSAIKAKLIELGAYVDDELPDYIMVMVANKKTQKQMTDDLSLFLSTNTEKFTSWLHGLLKKLQSINTEQAATKQKVKEKQKGEKKKRKSSHSEKPTKTSDQEEGKSSTAENIVQKETSKKEKSGTDTKDGVKKEKVKVTAKPSGTQVGKAEQKTEDEQGTEINISENTDEFNEENKEIEKHEKVKQLSTGKPPPAKVKKTEKTSDTSKEAAKIASRENRVSGKARSSLELEKSKVLTKEAVKKKPSSFVAAVKRRYEEEEEHEEYDPMNPAVGSVASVVRGPSRKSSIPKSMQANKSLLMKAVSDAEKSVTSSKKQEDIPESKPAMRSDRKAVDLSHRLKTAAGLQLVSRSRRKEMQQGMKSAVENDARETLSSKKRRSNEDLKGMKFKVKNEGQTSRVEAKKTPPKAPAVAPTRVAAAALKDIEKNKTGQATAVVSSPAGEDEEEEYNDEEQYGPPLPDTRLVQHVKPRMEDKYTGLSPESTDQASGRGTPSESASDAAADPEIQRILEEADDTELDLNEDVYFPEEDIKKVVKKEPRVVSPKDPRFIVTLDGVDRHKFEGLPDLRHSLVQTVKPVPKYEPSKIVSPESMEPKQTEEQAPPQPQLYSKITPPKIKPFNINLKDTDDEEEMEEDGGDQEMGKAPAMVERCRFWPACANGNNCQYVHPTVPCKMFPFCKFGEKCLYIHPNCKFDAKCSKSDCPYTHATRRTGGFPPTIIQKIVQVPVSPFLPPTQGLIVPTRGKECRFFPNCKNMTCPFVHPKPCRYGIGCMNKATCTFHHPPLPEKDKLKWSSTSKKDNTTGTMAASTKVAT